ncbi:MAG TPA: NAD(P)H-hydrate dehydratase [Ramlibacter sp.]|uniref:NAD(P)H-hydrate dehydratase n=1 Tax=Ramlibacter sp. TaxID=1917967 RepID=UPI002C6B2B20|nr:NAD(P)H-hydrate dehydratase [Ramlibacter sp.]HVZ43061.1 NAD(P)H-hydrate dehydratase [Ramlibacter sp.]
MQRITPERAWPLFDIAALRGFEASAAARLPPHTLMQRAGFATARLAAAIAPHARAIWIACGPGNNGGDGLAAAVYLKQWGRSPLVTWLGNERKTPHDAMAALELAREAGVEFIEHPPTQWDLGIDALLGIGGTRAPEGRVLGAADWLNRGAAPVLAIDIPTGLMADTGAGMHVRAAHTLTMIGLKPGLFTAQGRDAAGVVWLDDLGVETPSGMCAMLSGPPTVPRRLHASHKGSFGDVAVIGGAPGMTGAALLAATSALHSGAGRVYVCPLDDAAPRVDIAQPDLMFRAWDSLDLASMAVAAGCGGGDAVRGALPKVLSTAKSLVLDADALNAIAADPQLQSLLRARAQRAQPTVLTPHPLEAARLLETGTEDVQSRRLACARELAQRWGCVVVLKGSGTVIAANGQIPRINPTGNARLATAGTGDVLAGMVVARLAQAAADPFEAACAAVRDHGSAADAWPRDRTLTASALASSLAGSLMGH